MPRSRLDSIGEVIADTKVHRYDTKRSMADTNDQTFALPRETRFSPLLHSGTNRTLHESTFVKTVFNKHRVSMPPKFDTNFRKVRRLLGLSNAFSASLGAGRVWPATREMCRNFETVLALTRKQG